MHKSDFFSREDCVQRQNLVLLGDSLGDAHMSDGIDFDPATLLRIGFLNDKVEERMEAFLATFDVVILGDPDFSVPLELIRAVCNNNSDFLVQRLEIMT